MAEAVLADLWTTLAITSIRQQFIIIFPKRNIIIKNCLMPALYRSVHTRPKEAFWDFLTGVAPGESRGAEEGKVWRAGVPLPTGVGV